MKKILVFTAVLIFTSYLAVAQSAKRETTDTTGTEYVAIEGRSETGVPNELQGTWILVSGVNKTPPAVDINTKKLVPGTEKRDSVTTTTTVNGETRTITEVNIDLVTSPEKQITPQQKDKMHKPEKPTISFYGSNETFSGFTGCNRYSGRYSIQGNKISLTKATASTKMVCLGDYDETAFLDNLKKVNAFRTNNGNLELLDGEQAILVFARK